MKRAVVSVSLCAAALVTGIQAAFLAAKNRARAGSLDEDQREYEAYTRYNDLLQAEVEVREWHLLAGEPDPYVPPAVGVED